MRGVRGRPFALNEVQEVWLTLVKVGMGKLNGVMVVISTNEALLEGRYLAEAVEVELTNEGREVLMFEPFAKYFLRKPFVVVY